MFWRHRQKWQAGAGFISEPAVDRKILLSHPADQRLIAFPQKLFDAVSEGATKWGKLKSGVGWVSLDYCKKL